ncbi:MAG: hypothetical protein PHR45_07290, partial [Muribaculaceae bacterium]|nr:hypothetical protein [Muribaculaceae bacterium]
TFHTFTFILSTLSPFYSPAFPFLHSTFYIHLFPFYSLAFLLFPFRHSTFLTFSLHPLSRLNNIF